jgi:hypothetical protein
MCNVGTNDMIRSCLAGYTQIRLYLLVIYFLLDILYFKILSRYMISLLALYAFMRRLEKRSPS